jgi:hypothetical protein
MFVMYNDTVVCKLWWLDYLMSKLTDDVRGAAVSRDSIHVNAMHFSGFLFDFRFLRPLKMSFLPGPPDYDICDLVSIRLREAGYRYFICQNAFNDPETVDRIDPEDPLRTMQCARVFGDDGQ